MVHEEPGPIKYPADEFAWMQSNSSRVREAISSEQEKARDFLPTLQQDAEVLKRRFALVTVTAPVETEYRLGGWSYRSKRTEAGFIVHLRSAIAPTDGQRTTVLLDESKFESRFVKVGMIDIHPNGRLLAYTVDVRGHGRYELRIKAVGVSEDSAVLLRPTDRGVVWSNDGRYLFYISLGETNETVALCRVGVSDTNLGVPEVVWEHPTDLRHLSLFRTKSRKYIVVRADSHSSTEIHALDLSEPETEPRPLRLPFPGARTMIDHAGRRWVAVQSNDEGALALLEKGAHASDDWREVPALNSSLVAEGMELFDEHVVLFGRRGMTPSVLLVDQNWHHYEVDLPPSTTAVAAAPNPDPKAATVRLWLADPAAPDKLIEFGLDEPDDRQVKEPKLAGRRPANEYVTYRLDVTSTDGVYVPMTILQRRDQRGAAPSAGILVGYGAYGVPLNPGYAGFRLPLLDLGVAFAFAHVRGGGELGRAWHSFGRREHRGNAVRDFVSCADALIARNIVGKGQLAARGASAGAFLVATAINLRPELFRCAVLHDGFLDPVSALDDNDLPLTELDRDEWGDPRDPAARALLSSLSPYENLHASPMPWILATARLDDSRVPYWQTLKWITRARKLSTSGNPIVSLISDAGGHAGLANRLDARAETAVTFAFVCNALKVPVA